MKEMFVRDGCVQTAAPLTARRSPASKAIRLTLFYVAQGANSYRKIFLQLNFFDLFRMQLRALLARSQRSAGLRFCQHGLLARRALFRGRTAPLEFTTFGTLTPKSM